MKLRSCRDDDRQSIIGLREAEGLPTSDLHALLLRDFLVVEDGNVMAGCVGAEVLDDIALLRSLVVSRSFRGQGLAKNLISALEARLSRHGVADIWLLTLDADGYFRQHGYLPVTRDRVPARVQETKEFSILCPDSAVVMRKQLRLSD